MFTICSHKHIIIYGLRYVTYKYRTAVANVKKKRKSQKFSVLFSFSEVIITKGGYAKWHNHEHDQSLYQDKRS